MSAPPTSHRGLVAEWWSEFTHEEHALSMRMYFRDELVLMLRDAGFCDIDVRGGYDDAPPTGDHEFLVVVARA